MAEDKTESNITPLDEAYEALDPDKKKFVDAMCDEYEKIISEAVPEIGDETKQNIRVLTKGFAINALKGAHGTESEQKTDN